MFAPRRTASPDRGPGCRRRPAARAAGRPCGGGAEPRPGRLYLLSLASFLAAFFLIDGIIGIVAAIQAEDRTLGTSIGLGAAVSLLLGLIMLLMLPEAAPWLLGVLVGVHLIADGIFSLLLAGRLKRKRRENDAALAG